MNLTDLQKALRAVEPAAVLVPPRVLENIIWQAWNLSGFFWAVPHRQTFIIDRQTLFRHVDQEELVVETNELLPPTVILLAWPGAEMVQAEPNDSLLLKYWQRLFHASVHLVLETLFTEDRLTPADLRVRLDAIGPTPFEEIRNVLVQDYYLAPSADERTVYIEFAAVFLEQYYFSAGLLESTFPSISDREAIRRLIERDVDGEALFQRTRLTGAADPVVRTATGSQEPHEYYYKLIASSDRASELGNVVLAAIQKRRAARVAPPALAHDTMESALADIQGLATRLKAALSMDETEAAEWQADLLTLLDKADQGTNPPEAALLYDLQKVCLDSEQDIYALDLVEWLRSMGKRPIKRPLPSQRLVRLTRHLSSATQRLTMARLSDTDRKHLAGLLQIAQQRAETHLRERFRPVIVGAFEDVGLKPRNPPERTAFTKMVEELLDRILDSGFLTFSDLRDSLSRNLLKMPDLSEPHDFIRGDPLLRLDRRLATLLDGVYRPGEFYLRWLERFTALNFGTVLGRKLTRFVTMPFGAAFLILATIDILFLQHWHLSVLPLEKTSAPLSLTLPTAWGLAATPGDAGLLNALAVMGNARTHIPSEHFSWYRFFGVFLPFWLPLSLFMLGLLHSARVRRKTAEVAAKAWRPLRALLIEGPIWMIRNPALKRIVKSWSFQLFYWFFFKPLLASLVVFAFLAVYFPGMLQTDPPWLKWVIVFLVVNVLVNTKPVQDLGKWIAHVFVQFIDLIRAGLIPSLFNLTVRAFKRIIHWVEALLFYVDEWLRFRQGDSQLSMVVRALLTVLWFPISYLARLNMVLLIEPALNPVKLPVCLIAAKFWYPLTVASLATLKGYDIFTYAVVYYVWYMFPDFFGFLFWEIKENWSLYRANRSPTLRPISVGPHGETLPKLLQPGFHAGTVPKLFAKLRQAERAAYLTGNWSSVRYYRAELEHIEEAVRLFVARDFISLLEQNPHWKGLGLTVGPVRLATNRIDVELVHPQYLDWPLRLQFENRSGWMIAGLQNVGWLPQLQPEQMGPLHNALVTLYKLAGVDLVSEQLQAVRPEQASGAEVTYEGWELRLDGRPTPAASYNLRVPSDMIAPELAEGISANDWPAFLPRQILFREIPITWEDCVRTWQSDHLWNGSSLLAAEVVVLPPTAKPAIPSENGTHHHDVKVNGETVSSPSASETTAH